MSLTLSPRLAPPAPWGVSVLCRQIFETSAKSEEELAADRRREEAQSRAVVLEMIGACVLACSRVRSPR